MQLISCCSDAPVCQLIRVAVWQHCQSSTSCSHLMNVVQVAINVHGGPGEDHGTRLDLVVHILKVRPQQASGDRRH